MANLRIVAYFVYTAVLETLAILFTSLAIYGIISEPANKLRIWTQFEEKIPHLLPILTAGAGVFTVLCPIVGVMGVIRKHQITIAVFVGLMVVATFLWTGIAGWCISLQKLIIGDIDIIFSRLERDGEATGDAREFLRDLRDYMPRLSSNYNYMCCQQIQDISLYGCASECRDRYKSFFQEVIFPVIYSVLFGAAGFCILALVCGFLVCCYLDDVKPAF